MKTEKLFQFLYGDSQVREEMDGLPEDFSAIFEEMERAEAMEPKKSPLSSALSSIGVSLADLKDDPEGFFVETNDEASYLEAIGLLRQADNIHKLAELGWVAQNIGDDAPQNAEPHFRIRFLELTTVDTSDKDKAEKVEKIIKAAREFIQEPMDRPKNFRKPKGDGVGKASAGEQPAATKGKKIESLDSTLNKVVQEKILAVKTRRIGKLRKSLNGQNPSSAVTL